MSKTHLYFRRIITLYSEKVMTPLLFVNFGRSAGYRTSLMTHLDSEKKKNSSQKHVFLSKNIHLKIWHYLTWHWPPLKIKLYGVIGLNDHFYRNLHAKCPRKHVAHDMLVTYLLVTFCDLTSTSLESDLCTHAVPFLVICQHFGWVWALYGPSNRAESPKVEKVRWHLTWPWPDTKP